MKTILAVFGFLFLAIVFYFIGVRQGWWKNIFVKIPPPVQPDKCDPNNPGFTKAGIRDTECGTVVPLADCDPNKCDPNNPGYDECGAFSVACAGSGRGVGICSDCSGQWQKEHCEDCKNA